MLKHHQQASKNDYARQDNTFNGSFGEKNIIPPKKTLRTLDLPSKFFSIKVLIDYCNLQR